MTRLKVLLWIVAISQLALGALTLLVPATFFAWMGLAPPPPDNAYMLGMLAARFLVLGVMFVQLALSAAPNPFVVRGMVLIQIVDFCVGAFYLGTGTITLATAGFPMFNAALFATLLWLWQPRQTTGPAAA